MESEKFLTQVERPDRVAAFTIGTLLGFFLGNMCMQYLIITLPIGQ
jgi:hypothetical protein